LDVGLPAGPEFFRYADPDAAAADLAAAGFADMAVTDVAQIWELPTAAHAVDGLLHGTVRIGALLGRQPPGVLDRMQRSVAERLASYEEGTSAHVPMPAVVVEATKP